jgi:hypothetical protein
MEIYNTALAGENSAGKSRLISKRSTPSRHGALLDPPLEIVRIPFEGRQIVGYLRLPPKVRPRLCDGISGLDTRKEDVAAASDNFLRRGIGLLHSTCREPVRRRSRSTLAPSAYSRALDYRKRARCRLKRIVVRGQSWSGYWAAKLAYTERERIRGAVAWVGIHGYFQPSGKQGLTTREYLFDLFPARGGVRGSERWRSSGLRAAQSLLDGFLDKPSAPMLLVNGEKDTQQPIADLYLMMKHGDPKIRGSTRPVATWAPEQWPQRRILERVVMPWIEPRVKRAGAIMRESCALNA